MHHVLGRSGEFPLPQHHKAHRSGPVPPPMGKPVVTGYKGTAQAGHLSMVHQGAFNLWYFQVPVGTSLPPCAALGHSPGVPLRPPVYPT